MNGIVAWLCLVIVIVIVFQVNVFLIYFYVLYKSFHLDNCALQLCHFCVFSELD